MITEQDIKHLKRCVELAESALEEGNQPFGSILVSEDGNVLFEDYNRISSGDDTQHPEFSIARYAAEHLSKEERARAIVYTSGEHCPMCSAAHGWVRENYLCKFIEPASPVAARAKRCSVTCA